MRFMSNNYELPGEAMKVIYSAGHKIAEAQYEYTGGIQINPYKSDTFRSSYLLL